MPDIKELAISYWRLERWINNAPVEKKLAANSALRNIKKYLDAEKIKIVDPVGQPYDIGMSVDVVHNNLPDGTDESQGIISETIKPIIYQDDSVVAFGQIVLGDSVKEVKEQPQPPVIPKIDEQHEITNEDKRKKDLPKKIKIAFVTAIAALNICSIILLCMLYFNTQSKIELLSNNINSINDYATSKDLKDYANDIVAKIENNDSNIDGIKDKIDSNENKLDGISSELEAIKNRLAEQQGNPEGVVSFIRYQVVSGDTLYNVCKAKGIDYAVLKNDIINLNNIEDPDKIYVGQILYLPIITD